MPSTHRAAPGPLRSWARPRIDPVRIARSLAPSLRWPGAASLDERSWRRVAWEPEFDAWLIAWPRRGMIDLHDHGDSRGALHVVEGALTEYVLRGVAGGRCGLERNELSAGTTHRLGQGHVHSVVNESERHALSVHVYSPALSSMTFFDLAGDGLVARDESWSRGDDPAPPYPLGDGATAVGHAAAP